MATTVRKKLVKLVNKHQNIVMKYRVQHVL